MTPWTVASVHGDSSGKNTRVGCHALFQGIFPTQGSNPGLPHCRRILYCLSHQGRTPDRKIKHVIKQHIQHWDRSTSSHPAYLTYLQSTPCENTGLDETQAGIKTDRRNINNFRYADDTILMAESEKELKSLLMKVKQESEKAGLKLNI